VLAANALGRVVGLVVVILVARHLREDAFGLFSFVFAYVETFATFTDLGISAILVREIARDRSAAGRLLGVALALKLVLSVGAILLAWALIAALPYPWTTRLLVGLASLALFTSFRLPSFRSLFDVVFQVDLAMRYPVWLGLLSDLVAAAGVLLVISLGGGLGWLVAVHALAGLPGSLVLARRFGQVTRVRWIVDLGLWRRMLAESLPLALAGIFVLIYSRIDVLMLSLMKGDAAVGYYAAAYRLTGAIGLIPSALMVSLYPLMSRYHATDAEALHRLFHRALDALVLLGAPIAVLLTVLSGPLSGLIYGEAFLPSAPALAILGWVAALNFLSYLVMTTLNAVNRQDANARLAFAMILLNVAANLFLIPRLGFVGASVATLLTEALVVAVGLTLVARHLGGVSPGRAARYCAAAGAAGILLYAIPIHPILQLLVGLAAYGAVVWALRGVTREELATLKTAFTG
jgi:O-antigen/teichoic acid export membrane protein